VRACQEQDENNESDLESNLDENKTDQVVQPGGAQEGTTGGTEQPADNKTPTTSSPATGAWPVRVDSNAIPRLSRQLFGAYTSTGGGTTSGTTAPTPATTTTAGSGANSETESSAQETTGETTINGLTNSLDQMEITAKKVTRADEI